MAEKVKTNTFQRQPVASDLGVSWRLARDASLPGLLGRGPANGKLDIYNVSSSAFHICVSSYI